MFYTGLPTDSKNNDWHWKDDKLDRLEIHFSAEKYPTQTQIFNAFQDILKRFKPESEFYQFKPKCAIIGASLVGWQQSYMVVFGLDKKPSEWPEIAKIPHSNSSDIRGLERSYSLVPVTPSWWL